MSKNSNRKISEKQLEDLLQELLSEVKKLRSKQKRTKKHVKALRAEVAKIESCKCRKSKKKKSKKKNKKTIVEKSIEATGASSPALQNVLPAPLAGVPDDLKWISGVGPKLEETLNGLGVYHFEQIADWSQAEIDWVDDYLNFSGRIVRDNWIEQAKALAKGGWDEYVRVFGKEPR